MNKLLKSLSLVILLFSIQTTAQDFFVNTIDFGPGIPPSDNVYRMNVLNASETVESFCLPTGVIDAGYTDIAVDKLSNFYYVTSTGLLYRYNKQEGACEFLGDFSTGDINSLVADSENNLYAIGTEGILYKYDVIAAAFSVMGNVQGVTAGGDLFFYESRLFLTITTGILEINMTDPSQSCPFINTGSQYPSLYAAFSINYGTYSKAYITSLAGQNSLLYEVDMVNKQIGDPIRMYNHRIYGAATAYSLTSGNASCSPVLSTVETVSNHRYFDVINPSGSAIAIKTDIGIHEVTSIRLYDLTGRMIRDFPGQNHLQYLDISGVFPGNYLLTLTTKKGEIYTKKIIVKS
ncbi:T9SS type A sorting domain-containing protein [Chryseobacterium sp. SN22]|uniref:T9SS type A sorting domain-containing protein n=1 Tax=Chryseobacterium sp. SN22 TaxID=2606431 RepID=UPI0011ED50F1|nr:T9SS type A sorting domain-containing protein [Chryseobacterium sp. SN22]KAA0126364.1 T9SS type A sorting domain-containing protein [Chryseobacterium sp. SN22]